MLRQVLTVIFIFFAFVFCWKAVRAAHLQTGSSQPYSLLPEEKEGQFPVAIPEYNGVEQLIVLSNRWVVVVTSNIDDVVQKIDEMTHGEYRKNANNWLESEKKNRPDWGARERFYQLQKDHYSEARELAGERNLDSTSFYSIESKGDTSYRTAKNPLRVTRFITALGEGKITGKQIAGGPGIYYNHYSYLEMPFPLKGGDTYTITLENGKSVTFLYDEMRAVSRAIKVNQVGYLSHAPHKYAYLGGYLHEFGPLRFPGVQNFFVVNANTGQVAYQGKVRLRAENTPLLGEQVYELDFSGLKEEGNFFISVPGVGRSWTFKHSPDALGEAFYHSMRALYHQRSGMAIDSKFSAWSRPAYHTEPVYESENIPFLAPVKSPDGYEDFDVVGYTIDRSRETKDAKGGWYDAADWDKNIHHYTCLFDLLYSYELFPEKFYDGQLHIPESGNGIPDILDEAEYGLLVWKKSLDKRGGVAGAVETWTHPSATNSDVKYAYSLRTRWSSLLYAAAAAQYAHLVQPFSQEKAQEYSDSARQAYAFGNNPDHALKDHTIRAAKERGFGEPYTLKFDEKDKEIVPFQLHARLRLYILTEDEKYLEGLGELLKETPKPNQWPYPLWGMSGWHTFSLFHPAIEKKLPKLLAMSWKGNYLKLANEYVGHSFKQPYRHSWPGDQDFWMAWGNTTMTNQARTLLMAYYLTEDQKYWDAAIQNVNYMLGVNPMGMSWTTGLGYTYPIEIQHANSEDDNIVDPIPGLSIFGTTGYYPGHFKEALWEGTTKEGKKVSFMKEKNKTIPVWRRFAAHPHTNVPQNEFTVYQTLSPGIFAYALMLPNGWMPEDELKEHKPRKDDLLFGFWYLP